MKGIIYKATNTFNGKVYIGQTIAGLPKRKSQHYKDAKSDSDNIFHVALYQYPNAFEWETIDTFTGTREEVIHSLNVAEEYHILKFNSTDERYGYNATYGGYSSDKFAEHIKRRAREQSGASKAILQYDVDGNFIREFSSLNEVAAFLNRDKISPSDIITGLHYNSQWRLKKNEYYPKHIGEYNAEKGTIKTTPIIAYNPDGTLFKRFASSTDAEKATGVSKEKILTWSKGKTPSNVIVREQDKKPFYFFRDADDYPGRVDVIVIERKKKQPKENNQRKRIAVYSSEGKLIEVCDGIRLAAAKYQCGTGTIREWCRRTPPFSVFSCNKKNTRLFFQNADGNEPNNIQIIVKRERNLNNKKMEHRIIQYSLEGKFIKIWNNTNHAAEAGMDTHAIIRKVLRGVGTRKSPNYLWRFFSEDYPQKIEAYEQRTAEKEIAAIKTIETRPDDTIEELNWMGEVVAVYRNTADAAKNSGCSQSYICNVLAGKIKHPKRRFRRKAS